MLDLQNTTGIAKKNI